MELDLFHGREELVLVTGTGAGADADVELEDAMTTVAACGALLLK
jgi:hypothetical protein